MDALTMDGSYTMPTTMRRAATTTSSFTLSHDMAPVDPLSLTRSRTMYEPSQGEPSRDFRMKGYPANSMIEAKKPPTETVLIDPSASFKKVAVTQRVEDPGKSDLGDGTSFYFGKYSSTHDRQKAKGLGDMFTTPQDKEVMKHRTDKHQQEIESYLNSVRQAKELEARKRDAEKRADLEMLSNYDPWAKKATTDNPRLVSLSMQEKKQEKHINDAYAAKVFGKDGSGAPNRTQSGRLKAQYTTDANTEVSNVFRGNHATQASHRYGKKDNTMRDTLSQQAMERRKTEMQRRQESAMLAQMHQELDPFNKETAPPVGGRLRATISNAATGKVKPPPEQTRTYAETLKMQTQEMHERKAAELHEIKEAPSDYEPWGKGFGNSMPRHTSKGETFARVKPVEHAPEGGEGTLANFLGKPGAGAPSDNVRRVVPKEVVPDGAYHPFGKAGAGAPIVTEDGNLHTKVVGKVIDDAYTRTKVTKSAKQQLLEEQKTIINEKDVMRSSFKKSQVEEDKNFSIEDALKFGQGYGNPKRDEKNRITNQARPRADIIETNLDKGGGLGRKQKGSYSHQFHEQLSKQAQEKTEAQRHEVERERTMDQQHFQAANTWQGKEGPGAPRRDDKGNIHGRYGLDNEVHLKEIVDTARVIPKEEKLNYNKDLRTFEQMKRDMTMSMIEREHNEELMHLANTNKEWGKEGAGNVLKKDGKKVTKPAVLRQKDDVEWKLNAKAASKLG